VFVLLRLSHHTVSPNLSVSLDMLFSACVRLNRKEIYRAGEEVSPGVHMEKTQIAGSLKVLMEKTLRNQQKRRPYDLTGRFNLGRSKTESRETIEECVSRAQERLRARNFVGSIVRLLKCVILMPDNRSVRLYLIFEKAIELDRFNIEAYFFISGNSMTH
jgi:hypothetical protein